MAIVQLNRSQNKVKRCKYGKETFRKETERLKEWEGEKKTVMREIRIHYIDTDDIIVYKTVKK